MQDCLSQELERLLSQEKITTLLQPIVNIEKKNVFGYEALSRGPSDSTLHGAQMLFETAERCGLTSELDGLCLRTAARSWSGQGTPVKLFVNVSPAKLMPPEFKPSQLQELLETNRLKASDISLPGPSGRTICPQDQTPPAGNSWLSVQLCRADDL